MARSRNNFKIETVEMMVLFLLQNQDLYGYQLTTLIKKTIPRQCDCNREHAVPYFLQVVQE